MDTEALKKRIIALEERNKRVEADKAWEGSITRRILLALFTYIAVASYLAFVIHINPFLNAIVPTVGFLLSTLTLPFFKQTWKRHIYKQ